MRGLVLILLCLALALQGPVQARVVKTPCPMDQSEHAVAMDAGATLPMQDDCCNDADTFAKTGKPCKTGQECQASNPGLLVRPAQFPVAQPAYQPVLVVERFAPPDRPASVWRPPALN
jgi:hypothetical protein